MLIRSFNSLLIRSLALFCTSICSSDLVVTHSRKSSIPVFSDSISTFTCSNALLSTGSTGGLSAGLRDSCAGRVEFISSRTVNISWSNSSLTYKRARFTFLLVTPFWPPLLELIPPVPIVILTVRKSILS